MRHGQPAKYQYNVRVPDIVVTKAATGSLEVRSGLTRQGQAVQVYTMVD